MQQKELEKVQEQEKLRKYNEKLEREIKDYNPWGRQGCGAPIRDEQGHIVAARAGFFNSESPT